MVFGIFLVLGAWLFFDLVWVFFLLRCEYLKALP